MNTSGANGGNNYTWRARRNCNDDDDDDDDDHNSRLVLRPILGQLNDLVVPSTSYHLLRLPVNYQSRCLSFSLFLSFSLHVAACCAVRKRCVTKGILLYANNFDRNFMIVFRITINHETMRRGDVSKSYEDDR